MIIILHKFPYYTGSDHDHCTSLDGKNHGLNNDDVMVLETYIVMHLIDDNEKGRLVFAPQ